MLRNKIDAFAELRRRLEAKIASFEASCNPVAIVSMPYSGGAEPVRQGAGAELWHITASPLQEAANAVRYDTESWSGPQPRICATAGCARRQAATFSLPWSVCRRPKCRGHGAALQHGAARRRSIEDSAPRAEHPCFMTTSARTPFRSWSDPLTNLRDFRRPLITGSRVGLAGSQAFQRYPITSLPNPPSEPNGRMPSKGATASIRTTMAVSLEIRNTGHRDHGARGGPLLWSSSPKLITGSWPVQ